MTPTCLPVCLQDQFLGLNVQCHPHHLLRFPSEFEEDSCRIFCVLRACGGIHVQLCLQKFLKKRSRWRVVNGFLNVTLFQRSCKNWTAMIICMTRQSKSFCHSMLIIVLFCSYVLANCAGGNYFYNSAFVGKLRVAVIMFILIYDYWNVCMYWYIFWNFKNKKCVRYKEMKPFFIFQITIGVYFSNIYIYILLVTNSEIIFFIKWI